MTLSGSVALEVARRFGTPVYVFDAETVRRRAHRLLSALTYRPFQLLYSFKAHASVALGTIIRDLVWGVDACSPGDLAFAVAAGFPPSRISYVGHSMTDAEIDNVGRIGAFFTADSLDQTDRFGHSWPGTEVGLRINCGINAGFHPHVQAGSSRAKFGVHVAELDEAVRLALRQGLRIRCLHGHLGSDMLDPGPHLRLLECLVALARDLPDVDTINLGGGFGTPFSDDENEYDVEALNSSASEQLLRFAKATGRRLTLRIEPGSYLVRDAGFLLASVTEVRRSIASSEFLAGTDTSFNHLVGAVLYGTAHPLTVAGREREPAFARYDVVGNLMQAGDVLAQDRGLPQLRSGDVLVFGLCGAYTGCRATTFNERPRPGEVIVDGAEPYLSRRAETVDDLLAHQVTRGPAAPTKLRAGQPYV